MPGNSLLNDQASLIDAAGRWLQVLNDFGGLPDQCCSIAPAYPGARHDFDTANEGLQLLDRLARAGRLGAGEERYCRGQPVFEASGHARGKFEPDDIGNQVRNQDARRL